ncbi:MAG: hypothetical protein ACPGN3_18145 [Opitutales bacterium]
MVGVIERVRHGVLNNIWMGVVAALSLASVTAGADSLSIEETGLPKYRLLRQFKAPEARQGVAVDGASIYVVGNRVVAEYSKQSLQPKNAVLEFPEEGPIIHFNDGILSEGKLWLSHSNYPGVPMVSSLEVVDPETLQHERSHSFGITDGSLTWVAPIKGGGWYACFAHYGNRAAMPDRDHFWTRLVRFDAGWRMQESWAFPRKLVEEKFGKYSSSGGALLDSSWLPEGTPESFRKAIEARPHFLITGHDHTALFLMRLPRAGGVLEWVATIPFPSEGQAFALDPHEPGHIYSIHKAKRLVYHGVIEFVDEE